MYSTARPIDCWSMAMLSRLDNLRWEMRFGISTRGIVDIAKSDSCHYATVDYRLIHSALDRLDLQPTDSFVDVGCGKGRVLCCAARHTVMAVIGIEYSAALCAEATANAARVRGRRSPVIVHLGAAEDFDYSGATVMFMFNPFGPDTLDIALARIEMTAAPRVRMAFVNPSQSQDDVFARRGWSTYQRFEMAGHVTALVANHTRPM